MVHIDENSRVLIKNGIKGYLMVAYGSGLQGLEDYNTDSQVQDLFDLIEEVLDK